MTIFCHARCATGLRIDYSTPKYDPDGKDPVKVFVENQVSGAWELALEVTRVEGKWPSEESVKSKVRRAVKSKALQYEVLNFLWSEVLSGYQDKSKYQRNSVGWPNESQEAPLEPQKYAAPTADSGAFKLEPVTLKQRAKQFAAESQVPDAVEEDVPLVEIKPPASFVSRG